MLSNQQNRRKLILILLGPIVLSQIFIVVSDYGLLWSKRVWRARTTSAIKRSGFFLIGNRGTEFMDFIASITPTDASIVIPPNADWFSQQNILQFFLMPRRIISCQCDRATDVQEYSDICIRCLQASNHFIPSIGEFPPSEVIAPGKDFIPYKQDTGWYHGIYTPESYVAVEQPVVDVSGSDLVRAGLIDMLVIGGLFLFGAVIKTIILGQASWIDLIIFSVPLGGGILSWFMFLISWTGVPLSLMTVTITFAVLLALSMLLLFQTRRTTRDLSHQLIGSENAIGFRGKDWWQRIAWAAILLTLSLADILSVGRAYSTYDAIANWSLK
ncbi:MAG: hypothetical protein GTO18_22360 [Anaerolineales bacterium]|nr:hypothetical protein [Anaerolineales bacterium]